MLNQWSYGLLIVQDAQFGRRHAANCGIGVVEPLDQDRECPIGFRPGQTLQQRAEVFAVVKLAGQRIDGRGGGDVAYGQGRIKADHDGRIIEGGNQWRQQGHAREPTNCDLGGGRFARLAVGVSQALGHQRQAAPSSSLTSAKPTAKRTAGS